MIYDLVLFDVDGVFLSEERCFDTSALAVWELLYGPHFLGMSGECFTVNPTEEEIRRIRRDVFCGDQVLTWMKDRGINANWDMVYLVFTVQVCLLLREVQEVEEAKVTSWLREGIDENALQEVGSLIKQHQLSFQPDFKNFLHFFEEKETALNRQELLCYFNQYSKQGFDVDTEQFSRNSDLWRIGHSVFQEWYLGEELYTQVPRVRGKKGYVYQEIALAEPASIGNALEKLKGQGIRLGIGTGRPTIETEIPLKELGLYDYFEEDRIVSATDVVEAEQAYPHYAPLGKPGPYTYIKGYLTKQSTVEECIQLPLPLSPDQGKRILIVGDSIADYLAARKMGCDFAATLTGLTGQAARSKFEELQADYILNDVTEILDIFDID
ncbi:phosphoglycolate phosphatase-like HAD superfamily hydrolase [Croceifilum oryzae]|uniref:Phosphoglycolate phosphatase-like HAD superfamily hydrolase n=1 Tax=Croceifilum oryzae TaxID=1553429 RepID=A0AAJ1TFQ5_9BACL|nr:HAD family hydrolase [Croceifilum oryzae]MDQ0417654.1 phosphoglycolate phosphatase-like HAD superfamily hydrolase [Croceifilum oryzae]